MFLHAGRVLSAAGRMLQIAWKCWSSIPNRLVPCYVSLQIWGIIIGFGEFSSFCSRKFPLALGRGKASVSVNKPTENYRKGFFSKLPHKIPALYVTGAQAFIKQESVKQQLLHIISPCTLAWAVCCVGACTTPGSRSAEQHHGSPTPARSPSSTLPQRSHLRLKDQS